MTKIRDFEYPVIIPVDDAFAVEHEESAEGVTYAIVSNAVQYENNQVLEYLERARPGHWITPLKWVNTIKGARIEKQNPHFEPTLNKWVWLFCKTGDSAK